MPNRKSYGKDSTQNSFASASAIITFVSLECLVAVQALLVYRDHFLTVSQMQQRGVDQGLPFVWHFGMWGDLLIVSGLAAYVIGRYFSRWHSQRMLVSLALGFSSAAILSWIYTFSGMPEAHVQNHRLTVAGMVHLFYMAIAFAVFIQFLFFTKDISVRLLRAVSVLLFVHVFFGTHMALGIMNVISPLDWYPAQPLKSFFGWITVATVAFGLAWRNVGTSVIVAVFKNMARYAYCLAKWSLVDQNPESSEGYLKFLDYLCGRLIVIWFFGNFLLLKWREGWNLMPLILIVIIGPIYFLSRHSVKEELKINKSLFPQDLVPDELQLKDRITITLQVTLFMGLYMALAYLAQNIQIVSLFMLVIACIDFNTRRQINKKMRQYFSDDRYAPSQADRRVYEAIQHRRIVISWFLFELPHLLKEALRAAGCAIAFGVAAYGYFNNIERLNYFAYIILIGTLILNEIVTLRWRIDRDRRLKLF